MEIHPGQTVKIPTGIAIQLPSAGLAAFVYARSGLGTKHGIVPANCVGVIDSDYRGEIMVSLANHSDQNFAVSPGDRIAQLVVAPVLRPVWEETDSLEDTQRGARRLWQHRHRLTFPSLFALCLFRFLRFFSAFF